MKTRTRGVFEKVPGSGVWWIRYVDGSGRYRRERVGPYSLAEKLLSKRRVEALQGKKLPETLRRRFVSFAEIADDALVYSKADKRSYRDDANRMKRLVESWGGRDASSLSGAEMEQRLSDAARDEKWAPSTYNHYRSLLMLTYRRALRAKKVEVNPTRDVEHRREDNKRVRYLNQHKPLPTEIDYLQALKTEEERLRAVIQHDYAEHMPEFELAVNVGLRKGSQYGLTWEMVDWTGRMLNIPTSKNGDALHIPLNNAAIAALKTVYQRGEKAGHVFQSEKTGKPLANSRHWFEDALQKSGVTDFVWHDLRHTFASRLRMKGAKLEDIAELLGHKGLSMTKRYAHLGPNQLHEVAALLDSPSGTTVEPETMPEAAVSASLVN
jgi:site-specific recombinase XerD